MKYTNNEAYFDVVEEVDAIIDKNGQTIFAEIQGYVSVRYTGINPIAAPLMALTFSRSIAALNSAVCRICLFRS